MELLADYDILDTSGIKETVITKTMSGEPMVVKGVEIRGDYKRVLIRLTRPFQEKLEGAILWGEQIPGGESENLVELNGISYILESILNSKIKVVN